MQRLFLFLGLALIWAALPVAGQTVQAKPFHAWVSQLDGGATVKGYLTELGDSSVALLPLRGFDRHPDLFPVPRIKSLMFRRKGRIGRGALIGAVVGFATGFLVGVASAPDCPPNSFLCFDPTFYGLASGIVLGLPLGTLAGWATGSSKTTISIGGSQQRYEQQRARLKQYQFN